MISDPLTQVCFKDLPFIQNFGLNLHNILDYFALSQFYDRTCNNELLKMQTKFSQQSHTRLDQMVGHEYVVSHFQDGILFIIQKRYRNSPTDVRIVESFYVLDGTIYKSPSVYDVLSMRIATTAYHLYKVSETVYKNSTFTLEQGRQWVGTSSTKSVSESVDTEKVAASEVLRDVINEVLIAELSDSQAPKQ